MAEFVEADVSAFLYNEPMQPARPSLFHVVASNNFDFDSTRNYRTRTRDRQLLLKVSIQRTWLISRRNIVHTVAIDVEALRLLIRELPKETGSSSDNTWPASKATSNLYVYVEFIRLIRTEPKLTEIEGYRCFSYSCTFTYDYVGLADKVIFFNYRNNIILYVLQ